MAPPRPGYRKSALITKVTPARYRYHKGDGDMWPITWAADDNLHGGAGDNMGSPMNSYNSRLGRYLLGSYAFIDENGKPRPYHQGPFPDSCMRSQLTLFEGAEPRGPWSLFHVDDDWRTYGDYQPCFPTKWMSEDGRTVHMVSSGSEDDYNFTLQRLDLETAG